MLWTEVVQPQSLTTVARETLDERERSKNILAQFLPNRVVDDISVSLSATNNGLVEVAEYRAYDAETPIGTMPGGKKISLELPPLGQKIPVSEYDQLRARGINAPASGKDLIGRATVTAARAVADRVEMLRGEILTTGKALISENQFNVEQDFGRDPRLTTTVGTKWDQYATATPIEDLQAQAEVYANLSGEAPGYLLVSPKVITSLIRCEEIRKMAGGVNGIPSMVTVDFLHSVLASFELPPLLRYDRKIRKGGALKRVIDEKIAIMLPAVDGEESPLGRTFWGTTLEAVDPAYGIAEEDRPGIVVGAYQEDDPKSTWVRANAIGMPVVGDANYTAAMTVL